MTWLRLIHPHWHVWRARRHLAAARRLDAMADAHRDVGRAHLAIARRRSAVLILVSALKA